MLHFGYNNYYKVLNAKDYGILQNRERIFIVSIREDIDNHQFEFPIRQKLKLKLKDLLEDEVDEKYYLSNVQIDSIKTSNYTQNKRRIQDKDSCDTLCARDWKDPKCIQVGKLSGGKWDKINESCRRVYDEERLIPTITTCGGGNTEPKVLINKATNLRIRKLTPKECFRLMGFDDEDVDILVENKFSNTQLYKMAGNSIVVNVLEAIFRNLFDIKEKQEQINISSWDDLIANFR